MISVGECIGLAFGGSAVALMAISVPFVLPGFRKRCLPYVPATVEQIENVITALKSCRKIAPVVDLGSGDGRIVTAVAKCGWAATGVELNSWLVLYSKFGRFRFDPSVRSRMEFKRKDIFKTPLHNYRSIVIFGTESMMNDFEQKVLKESDRSTNIVCCRFPCPNLETVRMFGCGIDTVWLQRVPKSSGESNSSFDQNQQ